MAKVTSGYEREQSALPVILYVGALAVGRGWMCCCHTLALVTAERPCQCAL
ncbi:MAG: hypothetical protein R3E31_01225 [Chloroflexota bacterium]